MNSSTHVINYYFDDLATFRTKTQVLVMGLEVVYFHIVLMLFLVLTSFVFCLPFLQVDKK